MEQVLKDDILLKSSVEAEGEEKELLFDYKRWRELYYAKKLNLNVQDENSIGNFCSKYAEGLLWTLQYYYVACPAWQWFYPFYYAPLASGKYLDI